VGSERENNTEKVVLEALRVDGGTDYRQVYYYYLLFCVVITIKWIEIHNLEINLLRLLDEYDMEYYENQEF